MPVSASKLEEILNRKNKFKALGAFSLGRYNERGGLEGVSSTLDRHIDGLTYVDGLAKLNGEYLLLLGNLSSD